MFSKFVQVPKPDLRKRCRVTRKQNLKLQHALWKAQDDNQAVRVPLWLFHSASIKSHLWRRGYSLRHRVVGKRHVVAWLE